MGKLGRQALGPSEGAGGAWGRERGPPPRPARRVGNGRLWRGGGWARACGFPRPSISGARYGTPAAPPRCCDRLEAT